MSHAEYNACLRHVLLCLSVRAYRSSVRLVLCHRNCIGAAEAEAAVEKRFREMRQRGEKVNLEQIFGPPGEETRKSFQHQNEEIPHVCRKGCLFPPEAEIPAS